VLDSFETEIIKNAVDFSDTVAKEVMTPRRDMICINKQKSFEENLQVVFESKYTRYPYIDGSKDIILIAIGVESEEQKSKLIELGIKNMQGIYIDEIKNIG